MIRKVRGLFSGRVEGNVVEVETEPLQPHSALPAAISHFASDLTEVVPLQDNFIFSPFSVHAALSLALFGAQEETAREMLMALHLQGIQTETADDACHMFKGVFGRDKAGMKQRQDIWLDHSTPFHQAYIDVVKDVFRAGVSAMDFSNAQAVTDHINDLVNRFTNGKVPVLLSPSDIASIQGMFPAVLTNILFHKGDWKQPFNPDASYEGDFHLGPAEAVMATYMSNKGTYKYLEGPLCKYLALPYTEPGFYFVCVLPNASHHWWPTLDVAYRAVLKMDWKGLLSNMPETDKVEVTLPKFRMTQSPISLAPRLRELGIQAAFDPYQADFGVMTPVPKYYISDVVHAAGIEIDEQGSEAGAATAVLMRCLSIDFDEKTFMANRPFLFFIVDDEGAVYFSGRLCDPTGPECS